MCMAINGHLLNNCYNPNTMKINMVIVFAVLLLVHILVHILVCTGIFPLYRVWNQEYLVSIFRFCPGGEDMRNNENSPRKSPKTHSQKLFLRINENSPRKWRPKTPSQKLFISLFRIMSSVKKKGYSY